MEREKKEGCGGDRAEAGGSSEEWCHMVGGRREGGGGFGGRSGARSQPGDAAA
jgi:hypothetical protein